MDDDVVSVASTFVDPLPVELWIWTLQSPLPLVIHEF